MNAGVDKAIMTLNRLPLHFELSILLSKEYITTSVFQGNLDS